MKKAVSEMLMLFALNEQERYIGEITDELSRRNGGAFEIVCPYSAIYRLLDQEYIEERKKRIAPDGRRRQYYTITPKGRTYLQELLERYALLIAGIQHIFDTSKGDSTDENAT
ncbi:MAG: PadR family transcriptional regulator [Butyricicoccus sp.]